MTGGTGFIGSHTAVSLIEEGFEVLIVDDLSNSREEVLDNIQGITGIKPLFKKLDLRDIDALRSILLENPVESIIHFAAKKAVGESVVKPLLYYDVNINSLLNLLKVMNEFDIGSLIFSSSCTVYGQPDKLPVTESTPYKPAESVYGNTKQIGEEIIRDYCQANDSINAISLRYFNPVGAHPSAQIGELPLGVPNNLVPFITQSAIGKIPALNVFGNDYNTHDGTAIRDYIHVMDLAEAHVQALKRSQGKKQKSNYEFFNVGTGKGNSVLDVIKSFEKVTEQNLDYQFVDRRPGDIEKIFADTRLAESELGWKAKRDLDDMMSSAWEWQNNVRNLFPDL